MVVDAPLDRLPMFIRNGGIIPSREPIQFVGEKPLAKLFLDIFPGKEKRAYTFYEDDGESFDYVEGNYRLTQFTCDK